MKKIIRTILASVMVAVMLTGTFGCSSCGGNGVLMKYYSSAADVLPLLKTGNAHVALLPEPAATKLSKIAGDKEWFRLDLQELYDGEAKSYPQAVLMMKTSVINEFPQIIDDMSDKFSQGMEWVKNDTSLAVQAVNEKMVEGVTPSLDASLNEQVVENCNIYWQSANNGKEAAKNYINDIISVESTAATKLNDDFFFTQSKEVESSGKEEFFFVVPDGAPALAVAKFMNDNEDFTTGLPFNYSVVAANNIGSFMQQGKADIMIMPINAASKLYKANASDPYQMVAIITHGNLYIVSDEEITLADLSEREVAVIGQGLVPDLTFKAVLKKHGMNFKVA